MKNDLSDAGQRETKYFSEFWLNAFLETRCLSAWNSIIPSNTTILIKYFKTNKMLREDPLTQNQFKFYSN